MKQRTKLALFVGQGPSMTCWEEAVERAKKHGRVGMGVESFAEDYCARVAITGRLGEFIAKLLGVHRLWLYARIDRVNLNAQWNGKQGEGDRFIAFEGRKRALDLNIYDRNKRVVLLGQRVAESFGIHADFLEVLRFNGKRYLLFPHPSGINRWWNEPGNRLRAQKALKRFLKLDGKETKRKGERVHGRAKTALVAPPTPGQLPAAPRRSA